MQSFEECKEKRNPDKFKAESLIKIANARIRCQKRVNSENALFVFEAYYSSTIEYIHLCLNGYHVSNHLCLGLYLKDELKEEKLYFLFDCVRQDRNSIIYHGKLPFDICIRNINHCKAIIKQIKLSL